VHFCPRLRRAPAERSGGAACGARGRKAATDFVGKSPRESEAPRESKAGQSPRESQPPLPCPKSSSPSRSSSMESLPRASAAPKMSGEGSDVGDEEVVHIEKDLPKAAELVAKA